MAWRIAWVYFPPAKSTGGIWFEETSCFKQPGPATNHLHSRPPPQSYNNNADPLRQDCPGSSCGGRTSHSPHDHHQGFAVPNGGDWRCVVGHFSRPLALCWSRRSHRIMWNVHCDLKGRFRPSHHIKPLRSLAPRCRMHCRFPRPGPLRFPRLGEVRGVYVCLAGCYKHIQACTPTTCPSKPGSYINQLPFHAYPRHSLACAVVDLAGSRHGKHATQCPSL